MDRGLAEDQVLANLKAVADFLAGRPDVRADALGIATSGIHRLDVVVGETAAFDPSSDVALPNRTPAKDSQLAEFSFIIDVHVEQSVQQCPAQLPSIRVCQ